MAMTATIQGVFDEPDPTTGAGEAVAVAVKDVVVWVVVVGAVGDEPTKPGQLVRWVDLTIT
jgi:hypothetical protein